MHSPKSQSSSIVILVFCIILKIAFILYIHETLSERRDKSYSYTGDDYPLTWPIPEPGPVMVAVEPTVHYQMNGTEASDQWNAMIPNNGMIYLGEHSRPFSIAMVHQLRCVDILRTATAHAQGWDDATHPPELVRHCLNYLRQAVLCQSDVTLDSVLGNPAHAYSDTAQCRDWDVVYREMLRNQAEHLA